MFWLHFFLLLLGGSLAASKFIIARKPSASALILKIAPFQGAIGVAMLVAGIINIFDGAIGGGLDALGFSVLLGLTILSTVFSEVVVGFLLGFGLIAKWIPGEGSAEQKGLAIQKKLVAVEAPLGIIAMVTAVFWLLFRIGVL